MGLLNQRFSQLFGPRAPLYSKNSWGPQRAFVYVSYIYFYLLQIKNFLRKVNTRKHSILFAVRVMMSSHIVGPLQNSTVPMWEMEIKKSGVGNHDLDLTDSDWVFRTPQAFRPYFGNSCSCFRLFSTELWRSHSKKSSIGLLDDHRKKVPKNNIEEQEDTWIFSSLICFLSESETMLLVMKTVGFIVLAIALAGVGILAWRRRPWGKRHVEGSWGWQTVSPQLQSFIFCTCLSKLHLELGLASFCSIGPETPLSAYREHTPWMMLERRVVCFLSGTWYLQSNTVPVQVDCPFCSWFREDMVTWICLFPNDLIIVNYYRPFKN